MDAAVDLGQFGLDIVSPRRSSTDAGSPRPPGEQFPIAPAPPLVKEMSSASNSSQGLAEMLENYSDARVESAVPWAPPKEEPLEIEISTRRMKKLAAQHKEGNLRKGRLHKVADDDRGSGRINTNTRTAIVGGFISAERRAEEQVRQYRDFTIEGVKELVTKGKIEDDGLGLGKGVSIFFSVSFPVLILSFIVLYVYAFSTGWLLVAIVVNGILNSGLTRMRLGKKRDILPSVLVRYIGFCWFVASVLQVRPPPPAVLATGVFVGCESVRCCLRGCASC